jgi:hypothetical protein
MYPLNKAGSAELPYTDDDKFKQHIKWRFDREEIQSHSLTKGNGEDYILRVERNKVHNIKDDETENFKRELHDIRMHARSHLTKADKSDKVRAVYGVPCTVIYTEIMILWPLMAHLKSLDGSFIAWGYETFRGGLEKVKREMEGYDLVFTLDFTTFDKLIPFWMIDDVHDIWKSFYTIGPYYEDDPNYPNPGTTKERIDRLWNFVNYSVKHSIYRAPDGSRYARKHSGFPSGLLQTQLLGSSCNLLMITYALKKMGFKEAEFKIKVLGDDSCIGLKTSDDPKEILTRISNICKEKFNAIINVEKSTYSVGTSSLQFLSYKFQDGAVVRVNNDLLGKLVYPEKAHFSVETTKSRASGIMISNLGFDEKVHAVCTSIIDYLRDIELTDKGLNWYDRERFNELRKLINMQPTRHDLFKLALTPQTNIRDENFDKFIR